MRARKNSTHGGYVSGEWWITQDGETIYADQDIGELGHEAIAFDHMVDKEIVVDGLLERDIIDEDEAKELQDDDVTVIYIYNQFGIPDDLGKEAVDRPEIWTAIKKHDARYAFIRYYGAILVLGENFLSYTVTKKTLEAIKEFVLELTDDDPDSNMQITVERIYPSQKYFSVPWSEFQFLKSPSKAEWWG